MLIELLPSRQKVTYNVGWVERNQTQRYAGFRPSNATDYNGGNLRNRVAPQPTIFR